MNKILIVIAAAILFLAAPAHARKKPQASLVQNSGAQPSGSPCQNSTIAMNVETEIATASATFPQGPWTYIVQGVAIFNNPQAAYALKAAFRGYIGSGDPNVDTPVNLGDLIIDGGQQQIVPFVLVLNGIAANDTKAFSLTATFNPAFPDGTVLQAECVSVGFLATEHN